MVVSKAHKSIRLAATAVLLVSVLSLAAVGGNAADSVVVSDVISGTGTSGPYLLTWSKMEAGSEWVSRNGIHLVRGIDYSLDANSATITFMLPLARSDMAYVTYVRQPDAVRRPQQPQDIALTLTALQSQSASLNLTARYNQGASSGLLYSLDAATASGQKADLRASFLISQPRAANGSSRRAFGWRSDAHANAGRLRLSGSLVQAEEGFSQAPDWGVAAGGTKTTLSADYRPRSGVSLTSSQSFAATAAGKARGSDYGLELSAGERAGLSALRSEQIQESGTSVRQKVQLRAKPGRKIDLRAERTDQNGSGAQVESDAMGLTLRPASSFTLSGGWARERGSTQIQGRSASVSWHLLRSLRLEGEYAENPADQSGRLQPANVSRIAAATELGALGLKAQVSSRRDSTGLSQSRDLSLLIGLPGKSVLAAGWSENDLLGTPLTRGTTTYSLGYTLGPKSDLSFSLAGKWLLFDDTLTLRQEEQQLEAKLTARF